MTAATNALEHELQLVHAAQWLYTHNGEPFVPGAGDPYARLVRGFETDDNDTGTVLASIARRGAVWRSRLDAWVVTDRPTARLLLGHPDLAVAAAVPQAEPWLPDPERQRTGGPVRDLARRGGPGAVRAYAGTLRGRTEQAVARLAPGPADLVADFVTPLTAAVYAGLLAVPGTRHADFAAGLAGTAPAVDALLCPQTSAVTRRTAAAVRGLKDVLAGRERAEADLVLAVAGGRAAADLLGNALEVLLERPAQWTRLGTEPAHAADVIDEVLRDRSPWRVHPLVALAPVEAGGVRIATGDTVGVVTAGSGGSHRDEAPPPGGPCGLLLPAARAQAEQALATLAARFPSMRPDGAAVRMRRAPLTRRLVRLPARLGGEETR
ncbi:hypothetical protein ACWD00_21195 [Streptomyces viridiviolaceus]